MQAPPIILGQRLRPGLDDAAGNDLQHMVMHVLSILRYRWWLFVLPLLTGTLAMLVGSLFLPREYAVRAVFERRDDPALIKLMATSPHNMDAIRRSMRFNLIGYPAVERAFGQILQQDEGRPWARLAAEPAKRQQLLATLVSELGVSTLESSPSLDVVEVRYLGSYPDLGTQIVRQLKDNYISDTQGVIAGIQQQLQRFFAEEVEKRRTRAVRIQAEMGQTLVETPEVDPARTDYLNQRLNAEQTAIEQLGRDKVEIEADIAAREDYLKQLDAGGPTTTEPATGFKTKLAPNPQRGRLQNEIANILSEIADAKTIRRMKEAHPHVQALNDKLKQLRIEFERLPQEIEGEPVALNGEAPPLDPREAERNRVEMELQTSRRKLDQLSQDLAKHQVQLTSLEEQKTTLFQRQQTFLLRKQDLANVQADLAVWNQKLEEINRAMTAETEDRGTKLATVEEARRPSQPVSPKLSNALLFSSGLGLALAVVAVFLSELLDRSFRHPGRVRDALGIPVLEAIGEIRVGQEHRLRWRRNGLMAVALVECVGILATASLLYLSLEHPDTYTRLASMVSMSV